MRLELLSPLLKTAALHVLSTQNTKLLTLEILKPLDTQLYSATANGKEFTLKSQVKLESGALYMAELKHSDKPEVLSIIKQPKIANKQQFAQPLSLAQAKELLGSKEPFEALKQYAISLISTSSTKDEFVASTNLLLSLYASVATVLIETKDSFSVLQFKKRYNKSNKKSALDFYAYLEFLGPIAGLVWLGEDGVSVEISVAFEQTKQFLQESSSDLPYQININILKNINPLFEPNQNSILDINA